MPEDDEYKIPVNGGRLKIKGVQDGRVTKKKKSKRKGETSSRKVEKQLQSGQSMDGAHDGQDDKKEPEGQQKTDDEDNDPLKGKTKAEIAYHEMNRKRVCLWRFAMDEAFQS